MKILWRKLALVGLACLVAHGIGSAGPDPIEPARVPAPFEERPSLSGFHVCLAGEDDQDTDSELLEQKYREYKEALKRVHPTKVERMRNRPKNPIVFLTLTVYRGREERVRLESLELKGSDYFGADLEPEGAFMLLAKTSDGNPFYNLFFSPEFEVGMDSTEVHLQFPLDTSPGNFEVYELGTEEAGQEWVLMLEDTLPSHIGYIREMQRKSRIAEENTARESSFSAGGSIPVTMDALGRTVGKKRYSTTVALVFVTLFRDGGAALDSIHITQTNCYSPPYAEEPEGEYIVRAYLEKDGEVGPYLTACLLHEPDFLMYADPGGAIPVDRASTTLQILLYETSRYFELHHRESIIGLVDGKRAVVGYETPEKILEGDLTGLFSRYYGHD